MHGYTASGLSAMLYRGLACGDQRDLHFLGLVYPSPTCCVRRRHVLAMGAGFVERKELQRTSFLAASSHGELRDASQAMVSLQWIATTASSSRCSPTLSSALRIYRHFLSDAVIALCRHWCRRLRRSSWTRRSSGGMPRLLGTESLGTAAWFFLYAILAFMIRG